MPARRHYECARDNHRACPQVWRHPEAVRTKRWWRCSCHCHGMTVKTQPVG